MISMYMFLKKNRFRKKWTIYKRIWMLSMDWTLLFYVAAFVGYIITVIFLEGNLLSTIHAYLPRLDAIGKEKFSYIVTALPLAYLFKSFQQPGILFSKSEEKLTTLPYEAKRIWFILALERWIKSSVIFSGIGIIYYLLSDTTGLVILLYIGMLVAMNILMTIMEWKLFQQSIWIKIGSICLALAVLLVQVLLGVPFIAFNVVLVLFLLQIVGYKRLLTHIDWDEVTMAANYKVWNMPMVSRVTKVSFKKERKFTIWQQRTFWKKSFSFQKNTLYHRLWQIYLEKNLKYILQIAGILLLLNIVLGFLKPWLFLIATTITVHVWVSLMATMFRDRFTVDVVEVLPWNLERFKRSYMKWVYGQTCILLLPFLWYIYIHWDIWNMLFLFVMVGVFLLLVQEKIKKEMHIISQDVSYSEAVEAVSYISLFSVLGSYMNENFLLLGSSLIIGIYVWKLWQHRKNTRLTHS